MSLIVPDEGELWLLQRMLRQDFPLADPFRLKLFTNDYNPSGSTVLADFVQCVLPGYATIDLDPVDWGNPELVGGVAQSLWSQVMATFAATSGTATVYGYYVTDADVNFCLWAERFATPLTFDVNNPVSVIPVFRLRSLF